MDWLSNRALNGRAATLHDKMARACLPFREAPTEFVDVVVCLSKKGLSDLPDLGHDRIAPYLGRRRVASHYPHLLRVPPVCIAPALCSLAPYKFFRSWAAEPHSQYESSSKSTRNSYHGTPQWRYAQRRHPHAAAGATAQ